jgi:hypothetical protein
MTITSQACSAFVGAQHAAPLTPPLKQMETLPDTIEFA